jgi:hypothetical protein
MNPLHQSEFGGKGTMSFAGTLVRIAVGMMRFYLLVGIIKMPLDLGP